MAMRPDDPFIDADGHLSGGGVRIVQAETPDQLDQTRALIRGFIDWLHARYRDRAWQVDTYYRAGDLEGELASLPGDYAPPRGRLLLAFVGGDCAGCVSLKPMDGTVCEVKRLFVRPAFQGRGIGRVLMSALIDAARSEGYRLMRLDTGDLQPESHALYRGMGFRDVPPYYEPHPDMRDTLIFMERDLTD